VSSTHPRDFSRRPLPRGRLAQRKNPQLNSFNELGLAAPIARALAEEKYVTPTPIQTAAIPGVLAGRDLVGLAQTGTGKTAAFALPILQHLITHQIRAERRACRVLVLSPTRELSGQILESFRAYGRHLRPSLALAIGGVSMGRQVRALASGVDVLVATPGRLLDLMRSQAVRLDRVETFVLDEADRMLDMGFIRDIRAIVGKLPAKRQTLFFSATMPAEIEKLVRELLQDPVRVAVAPSATTVDRVEQRVILIERAGKGALLAEMLASEPIERALVFTRTKHGADRVVRALHKAGIAAAAIHGNKSQGQRERVLAEFRAGAVRTLIATDIAARGIDVDGISHVINYDLPNISESYVHRIGRTARAGAAGIAISFCDADEVPHLRAIEQLIRAPIPATDRRHSRAAPREQRRPPHHHGGRQRSQSAERARHAPRPDQRQPAPGAHTDLGGVGFLNRKAERRKSNGANGNRRPAY
jgi:ATP-dependent RNA helicase RhlE